MSDSDYYGSIEFYEKMFSDILADVGTDDSAESDVSSTNILIAFERAIKGWIKYHKLSMTSYEKMLENFKENYTDV